MKKSKLYFYTKHQFKGASSRYRSLQYFSYLEKEGYEIVHRFLFSDNYLNLKYNKNRFFYFHAFLCIVKRFINLISDARRNNVFIIEKELFPYLPFCIEKVLRMIGVKYIVDYDDAIWHNYDSHRSSFIRYALGDKLKKVIYHSNFFIGGNDYLCNYAKYSNAKCIAQIPTVLSKARYDEVFIDSVKESVFTIVWIGSPSTSRYISGINSALNEISKVFAVNIKLIGFDEALSKSLVFPHTVVKWDSKTEITEMASSHLGIMPLPDTPFEKGKCGFKLIQYMAVGLPVIASPVGVNNEIVNDHVNGFKCSTNDQWYEKIKFLILNENLRVEMGKVNRQVFVEKYSLESVAPRYLKVIADVTYA